jgi:hypothetical protein
VPWCHFRLAVRRPIWFAAVLVVAGLTLTGLYGCASTTKPCATLAACSTAGSTQLGQAVLTPRGATFVDGSIRKGVLVIDFRDPPSGPAYKEFAGRPTSTPPACVGTFITVSATRRFCYEPTNTALQAEFAAGSVLYILLFTLPAADAASDQPLVTRIMASLS